jgi:8-oxo-dGTP pyrophosphatase MutT (NUDIX family)
VAEGAALKITTVGTSSTTGIVTERIFLPSDNKILDLDPEREGVEPRDAATLIVVRGGADGLEAFFVRRHAKSPFMGGAVVFPGGKLDGADAGATRAAGLAERALQVPGFAKDSAHALGLAVCACRESLEEAGIVPTEPTVNDAAVERMRAALKAGQRLDEVLAAEEATLATSALVPFARWITPRAESRRYDARFFVVACPKDQSGRPDEHEAVSGVWATPARMMAAFAAGDVFLAPPTLRALELLDGAPSVAEALARAARQSLEPICPTFVASDPPMLVIPGDPLHEVRERRVAGATRFVLREGRFVSEDPPA